MAGNDLSPYEAINRYKNLKIFQTVIIFILFGLGFIVLFIYPVDLGTFVIHVHMITWTSLFCGVLAAVAVVLLHYGNTNANDNMLNTCLVFTCLTYSLFDKCGGGFAVVNKRIVEIEATRPNIVLESGYSNHV